MRHKNWVHTKWITELNVRGENYKTQKKMYDMGWKSLFKQHIKSTNNKRRKQINQNSSKLKMSLLESDTIKVKRKPTELRKYAQIICLISDLSPQCINNSNLMK